MIAEAVERSEHLRAPFPWFGGKSRVSERVWAAFGDVKNYVEPFFGSGAVLLGRPERPENAIETVNDKDGFVANFWRAMRSDPERVAHWADWPVSENDLHARHAWLVARRGDLVSRLEGDPDFYDAKVAGWWVWGICCWIGREFCSGKGPWAVEDGILRRRENAGRGIKRNLPHLGNAGQGIHRRLPSIGDSGTGVHRNIELQGWFSALAERLRRVRVCCGDWSRVCGYSPTSHLGLTGVFLDPPYSAEAERDGKIYTEEDLSVAHAVREWAISRGDDPLMRIALCGYEGEHAMPETWTQYAWKAKGGYGTQRRDGRYENKFRERIWFSPHCVATEKQIALEQIGACA